MKNKIIVLPGHHRTSCRTALRARKHQERFLAAVRRLAPSDPLLQEAARRFPVERIHLVPQISAVNFVVAFQLLAPQPKTETRPTAS